MVKKIVILGNGFDLRHFLPTKYNHLITILREIENYNFSNSEVNFSDLFDGLFKEKDEDFYNGILNYYDVQNIRFNSEELKSIQERLKTNNWFQYLKTVEENKIDTWIDFETEINRVLKIIVDFFERFDENKNILHQNKRKFGKFILQKDNYSAFFKNNLEKNIIINFQLFDIINSVNSHNINEIYFLIVEEKIQYFKEKIFFDSIYSSLEEFIGIFNDYIDFIINRFYKNFKEEKEENFIKKSKYLFDNVVKIFSFNYTDTYFNYYIENFRNNEIFFNEYSLRKIENIHGYSIKNWDGKLDNLKIVLGVDDIEKSLKNNKLFQFTKYFQKLHKNTAYLFLDNEINYIKSGFKDDFYEFYFWGHSLDVSDKDYIKDVFYVVNQTESIIKVFYHSISAKADQLKNLLGIIDRNIIEDLMKKDRLIFIESTPENLFKELT